MNTPNTQLTRREFLKRVAQATVAAPLFAYAAPRGSRISYFCNGQIHVNEVGQPERKPLTSGQPWDFKPSLSKTGNHLVCFRRLKDDPVVSNWKSAIFIINADGTGFHTLSDGTHTDFNPTWTRDGLNSPIWNRKNEKGAGGYHVMQGKIGGKPGEEIALTDESFHTWGHSCLMDGRIVVTSNPPKLGGGIFLLTRREGPKPVYERVQCELAQKGFFHRMSVSPSEKRICFEFISYARQKEMKTGEPGHTLYVADFDVRERTITNLKPFANEEGKKLWFAYARWIDGESAIIYHSSETGKNQLYVYRLDDGSIKRVSTNPNADYRYPHGEAAPC